MAKQLDSGKWFAVRKGSTGVSIRYFETEEEAIEYESDVR